MTVATPSRPVALITGAARRIGRTIALSLAEAGFDIAVHYSQSHEAALSLVAGIESSSGRAQAFCADLSLTEDLNGLIPAVTSALGPLCLLVNNASRFESDTFADMTPELWQAHLSANLTAPVFLAQGFAAQPRLPSGASVINLIDQRVLSPTPDFFAYGVSKSALWSATQMMAKALAPDVRVNAVAPGPVLKSIHQSDNDFAREAAATALKTAVTPEAIAEAVLYLARATHVTGQMICVDSGQHLVS